MCTGSSLCNRESSYSEDKGELCCQFKAMGKEIELQRIVFNSLFFAIVVLFVLFCCFFWFFFFWCFFFNLEGRTEILPGETKIKYQFVFLPHSFFFRGGGGGFLSIFPLQKKKPTLKAWHFTDLKARHITASRILARCHKDVWCKWKEHCFWIAPALLNVISVPDPRKVIYILGR